MKSAKTGGSYEYQYHKNSGREKLIKDSTVGHLFFEYSDNLKKVELRFMHGSELSKKYFGKWLGEFPTKPEDYKDQRFRKSIPYGTVNKGGKLLMRLVDGEVLFPAIAPVETSPTGESDQTIDESVEE
ncbi:MAG TPA: hypothetical protein VG225_09555 [Terracidiphilus sp.]|nr:hypothetical protein [Terracidiphilus sp.]